MECGKRAVRRSSTGNGSRVTRRAHAGTAGRDISGLLTTLWPWDLWIVGRRVRAGIPPGPTIRIFRTFSSSEKRQMRPRLCLQREPCSGLGRARHHVYARRRGLQIAQPQSHGRPSGSKPPLRASECDQGRPDHMPRVVQAYIDRAQAITASAPVWSPRTAQRFAARLCSRGAAVRDQNPRHRPCSRTWTSKGLRSTTAG